MLKEIVVMDCPALMINDHVIMVCMIDYIDLQKFTAEFHFASKEVLTIEGEDDVAELREYFNSREYEEEEDDNEEKYT